MLSIQPHGGRLRDPACSVHRSLEAALIGYIALKQLASVVLAQGMDTMDKIPDLMGRS